MIEEAYGHLLPDLRKRSITHKTSLPGLTDPKDAIEAVDDEDPAALDQDRGGPSSVKGAG